MKAWVEPDVRDAVMDYVQYWSDRTALPTTRLVSWLGIGRSKFYDWKRRYGKVNEHNAWVPRDFWLEEWERQAIEAHHLAALAAHPESYPARLPAGARRILYLSHADSPDRLRLAGEVWSAVPEGSFDMCVAGDSVEGLFYVVGEKK